MVAIVLLTARLAPVLVLANPFAMLNMPKSVRAALVLSLAAALAPLVHASPDLSRFDTSALFVGLAGELVLGGALAFALNSAFGFFFVSGRILDTQAGFSLALVFDPSSKRQTPLVGTLFSLVAGSVFFATDGHHDLLRLIALTLQAVPPGHLVLAPNPELFIAQTSAMFMLGVVAAGASMVVLFLTDIALAVLSRTLPQMNILMLSLQVKALVMLLLLASSAGMLAPLILRSFETAFTFALKVTA